MLLRQEGSGARCDCSTVWSTRSVQRETNLVLHGDKWKVCAAGLDIRPGSLQGGGTRGETPFTTVICVILVLPVLPLLPFLF